MRYLTEGTFDEENFCSCLTSAFDHAVLMGERISDCILFGESIHNRLQICDTDCETLFVNDQVTDTLTGNWVRENDAYGVYKNENVDVTFFSPSS